MGDLGMKVSTNGNSVTGDDSLLLFSSAFSSLKVKDGYPIQVSTTIPATTGVNTITISHNSGAYVPHIVIYNGSTSLGNNFSYLFTDSSGNSLTDYAVNLSVEARMIKSTENTLTIDVETNNTLGEWFDMPNPYGAVVSSGSAKGDIVYFTVYVFDEDFETVDEVIKSTTIESVSEDSNIGFKVSVENEDVKTALEKDLIATSSRKSFVVNKKGVIDTAITTEVSHSLNYIPETLAFRRIYDAGQNYITYAGNNGFYDKITFDRYDPFLEEYIYYIIFKNRNV